MGVVEAVAFISWWLVVIPAAVAFFLWLLEGGAGKAARRYRHRHH